MDLTVTRKPVDVQTVTGKMLDDEIGYISAIEFDKVTDASSSEDRGANTQLKLILT
ncbi:MAG: hypothetical protein ACLUOI_27775 [Eisenbergiella sp.]